MAQVKIKIKLEHEGLNVFDEISRKMDAFASRMENIVAPMDNAFNGLDESANKVFPGISRLIKDEFGQAVNFVSGKVIDQTQEIDGAITEGIEKISARLAAAGLVVSALAIEPFQDFVASIISANSWAAALETTFVGVGNFLSANFSGLLSGLSQAAAYVNTFQNGFYRIVSQGALFSGSMLVAKVYLREITQFSRRILGFGAENLTIKEREQRTTIAIDSTLQNTSITLGQILKTSGFGIAGALASWSTGLSPFLAIIPFINQSITSIAQTFTRFRLRTGSFFGNSRAQLGLVFMDIKEIIVALSPIISAVKKNILEITRADVGRIGNFLDPFERMFKRSKQSDFVKAFFDRLNIVEHMKKIGQEGNAAIDRSLRATLNNVLPPLQRIEQILQAFLPQLLEVSKAMRLINQETALAATTSERWLDQMRRAKDVKFKESPFNIDKMIADKKVGFTGKTFSNFATSVFGVSEMKERSSKQIERQFLTLIEQMGLTAKNLNIPVQKVREISSFFQKAVEMAEKEGLKSSSGTLGTTFARALTATVQDKASPALQEAVKASMKRLEILLYQSGVQIDVQLARGIEAAKGQVGAAAEKTAAEASDRFPQSPAKKGPLRRLNKSGQEIVKQLSQGIQSQQGRVGQAAKNIADQIAGYFPQSLARFNPLRGLRKSGEKIVLQVSEGMKSKITLIQGTAKAIADFIFSPIDDAFRIERIARRTGQTVEIISLLDAELSKVGGTADSLTFVFQRLAKEINDVEAGQKLGELGISLEKIRGNANPVLALYLELIEVIKQNEQGTKAFNDALSTLGITVNSENFDIAIEGGKALAEGLKAGAEFGAFYTAEFAKASREVKGFLALLKRAREFFLVDLLTEVMPKVKNALEEFIEGARANNSAIKSFLRSVSSALASIFVLLQKTVKFAINEPGKARNVIIEIVSSTVDFLTKSLEIFIKNFEGKAVRSVVSLGGILVNQVFRTFSFIFSEIDYMFGGWARRMTVKVESLFSKVKKIIPEDISVGLDAGGLSDRTQGALFLANTISKYMGGQTMEERVEDEARTKEERRAELIAKISAEQSKELQNITEVSVSEIIRSEETQRKILEYLGDGLIDEGRVEEAVISVALAQIERAEAAKRRAKFIEDSISAGLDIYNEASAIGASALEMAQKIKDGTVQEAEQISFALGEAVNAADLEAEIQDVINKLEAIFAGGQEKRGEVSKEKQDQVAAIDQAAQSIMPEEAKAEVQKRVEGLSEILERSLAKIRENFKTTGGVISDVVTGIFDKTSQQAQLLDETLAKTKGLLGDFYAASGKELKAFFFMQKSVAIAEATINMARGIMQAIGAGGPLGIAQGAVVAAASAFQIGQITAQTIQGFAFGGLVRQGTGPRSDDVMARLSRGEFVIPADVVSSWGVGFFEALRTKALSPGSLPNMAYTPAKPSYSSGGSVNPTAPQDEQGITIINNINPNLLESYISSARGRKAILNTLGGEARELRRIVQNG